MNTKKLLQALEEAFQQQQYGTSSSPIELYEPVKYLMALGGKRLRPLMTLMAASLFTDEWQKALKPALAVEFFHNFTLMHDDIMDKAPLRRGKPTVNAKWNDNIAILSGDAMLILAYELINTVEDAHLRQVLNRFNRTAMEVFEGQQLDMSFETAETVTEEQYIEMIRLKTSVLLGFALELGAIVGDADADTTQALYDFGICVGLGFQLKDDLLDVFGDPAKFGKQVGGDIISNKKTFMLIEALLKAEGETAQTLHHWLSATDFDPAEKVKAVTEIYEQLGIKEIATQKINYYFDKAFVLLESLPIEQSRKEPLRSFVEVLIDREV